MVMLLNRGFVLMMVTLMMVLVVVMVRVLNLSHYNDHVDDEDEYT